MFVTMRKIVVKDGHADEVVERFSRKGIIEEQEGFVDVTVMKQKVRRGEDQAVVVMMRWESEKHWQKWQTSDAHVSGHAAKRGRAKADYLIRSESGRYEIEAVKVAQL